MKTCLTCGTASPESATFCSGCASTLNRGLPWYVAIPVSLGAGFALFAFDVLGEYAVYAHPDIRSQISTTIFLAVVVSVAVLWFSWLRFSVKRWRIRRAYLQGHEFSPGVLVHRDPGITGHRRRGVLHHGRGFAVGWCFWAVVVCVAVLWFSWLRFSVKRRRLRRAVDGREP
jgi:hypothetical protein